MSVEHCCHLNHILSIFSGFTVPQICQSRSKPLSILILVHTRNVHRTRTFKVMMSLTLRSYAVARTPGDLDLSAQSHLFGCRALTNESRRLVYKSSGVINTNPHSELCKWGLRDDYIVMLS